MLQDYSPTLSTLTAHRGGADVERKAVSAEEMTLSLCTYQGGWPQVLGAEGPFTAGVP